MASEFWNNIDNENYEFEERYCAFLDILGYKEKSQLFFENKYNLPGRIQRAMLSAGIEENPADSPDGIVTKIFSDSIMLSVPKTQNSLMLLINYTGMLVAYFGYEGLFLRGGISHGKYFEDYKAESNYSFMASQGTIKAYEMEQKAVYPMIVVDESLVYQINEALTGTLLRYQDKTIFNYVTYIINKEANNEDYVVSELKDIVAYKNGISIPSVAEKYEWIINYYLWYIYQSNALNNRFTLSKFDIFKSEINPKYKFG